MKTIELLAPAGSYEALIAAVQNGADAIYLGGRSFGARAYAENFDIETLKKAVDYAHVRGVKVYVTINTLIKDYEIPELIDYISQLYIMGVDAVIVQDLGVIYLIKKLFPNLEIHCSTQMALHNSRGINMLEKSGANRVVLARELSIEDIKKIKAHTKVELEVFVHGALCYCYSGLCLMSSFIGGRSGNRGRCAQPCRKTYEIVPLNNKNTKGERAYYLSTRDLKTIENIGEIIEIGVQSLKIEGRMKKPQYVACIVKAYREAIDNYMFYKKSFKDESVLKEITQIFNRDFTKGYLFNTNPREILNIEKPNNKGLFLGIVEKYNKKEKNFFIKILENIRQGDGIEIFGKNSETIGGILNKLYKGNKLVHEAKKGEYIEIELTGNINKGDKVYKTLDLKLIKDLEKTYSVNIENKKVDIWAEVKLQEGMPLKLYIRDKDGNAVYSESYEKIQKAQKVPLQREKLIENLHRLGNTPFQLIDLKIELPPNVTLPISAINKTRRKAIEDLISIRANKFKRSIESIIDSSKMLQKITLTKVTKGEDKLIKASVKVENLQQLKKTLDFPIDRIYYSDISNLYEAIKLCRAEGIKIYYKSPCIVKDNQQEMLKNILKKNKPDGILAGELGIIAESKNFFNFPIIADISLNIINSNAIAFLKDKGVKGITISPELDLKNIKDLKTGDGLEVEAVIYGKLPVMITQTCPLISINKCYLKCNIDCKIKPYQYLWALKDEKKALFPITKDNLERTIILNNNPIYMIDKIKDLKASPITSFRFEFTNENPQTIQNILIDYFSNRYYNKDHNIIYKSKINSFTRGHYYRGIE